MTKRVFITQLHVSTRGAQLTQMRAACGDIEMKFYN